MTLVKSPESVDGLLICVKVVPHACLSGMQDPAATTYIRDAAWPTTVPATWPGTRRLRPVPTRSVGTQRGVDLLVKENLKLYWEGRGPLWKVFWLWGVVGSWILAALFLLAVQGLGISWPLYLVTAVIMLCYTVWILVSVWRCAEHARAEHWGAIARALTVAWALNVILVGAFLGLDLLGAPLA